VFCWAEIADAQNNGRRKKEAMCIKRNMSSPPSRHAIPSLYGPKHGHPKSQDINRLAVYALQSADSMILRLTTVHENEQPSLAPLGERVARAGAFTSRCGSGEGGPVPYFHGSEE